MDSGDNTEIPQKEPRKYLRRGEGIARFGHISYPVRKMKPKEMAEVPVTNQRSDSGFCEESQPIARSQNMMAVVPLGSNASHDDVCSTDDRSLLGRLESDCLSARDPNDVSMLTEASILEHRAQWSKRELLERFTMSDFEKYEQKLEHNYSGIFQMSQASAEEHSDASGISRRSSFTRHQLVAIAENDHFGTSSAVSQVSFQPVSHLGSSQLPGSSTNELMATIQQRKFLDFFPQSNGCTSVASSVSDSNSSTPTLGHGSTNQHVVDRELEKLKQKLAGSRFFTGDILIDHQMPMDSVSTYSHATIETGSISTTNTDLRRAVVDGLTSRRLLNNPSYMENISVKPRETSEFHGLRPSQTVPTLHKLNQPTTSTTESSNVIPKVTNKKDLPAFLKNDPVQKPKEEDLVREELNRKMVELQELTVRLRTDHADIEENKRLYEMCLKEVTQEKELLLSARRKFEEERDDETRRLRHERLMLDKERSAARAVGKKECEENKMLREQLLELQNKECDREAKASAQRAKFKTQLDKTQKELADTKAELEKVKSRCEKAEKSNTKMEWELQQLRLRLTNRDKQPPIIQCDCDKSVDAAKSTPTSIMRKQSGDAKDTPKDPLDFYPILEKPTLNDSQPKTVRFNLPNGPDREWESQVDQQASVSDFAAVHPNAHPLIGVQPMCRSNSAVSLESPMMMGQNPMNLQYSVTNQVFRSPTSVPTEVQIERVLSDGSREITHVNGTVERLDPTDGSRHFWFPNGDTKRIGADGVSIYVFAATNTSQVTYPDGTKMIAFEDGHEETYKPDGMVEAKYPDGTVRRILPSGEESLTKSDGSRLERKLDGTEVVYFDDGSKETRSKVYVKREFPDGSYKVVYPDGTQHSFYSSTGRFRIKDPRGNIIADKLTAVSSALNGPIVA